MKIKEIYKSAILVIEIPHQGRETSWFAWNEADFLKRIRSYQEYSRNGYTGSMETFDDCVEFLGSDLRKLEVRRAAELELDEDFIDDSDKVWVLKNFPEILEN